jgi:hypothetical protein
MTRSPLEKSRAVAVRNPEVGGFVELFEQPMGRERQPRSRLKNAPGRYNAAQIAFVSR